MPEENRSSEWELRLRCTRSGNGVTYVRLWAAFRDKMFHPVWERQVPGGLLSPAGLEEMLAALAQEVTTTILTREGIQLTL